MSDSEYEQRMAVDPPEAIRDIRLTSDEAYALLLDRVGLREIIEQVEANAGFVCPDCHLVNPHALLRWIAERIAAPKEGR